MNRKNINYNLYVITDRKLAGNQPLFNIIESAIAGGATIIQYREKQKSTKAMIGEARDLLEITKQANIPLIINDRIDVALAVDADGVHVGQDDCPAGLARKLIGNNKILGVSVKSVNEAVKAVNDGADYLGVGDIFGTKTKSDAGAPVGLEVLENIAGKVSLPIVGIGGINKENAGSVISSGADGIAVISAIIGTPDPEKEARQMLNIITKGGKWHKR